MAHGLRATQALRERRMFCCWPVPRRAVLAYSICLKTLSDSRGVTIAGRCSRVRRRHSAVGRVPACHPESGRDAAVRSAQPACAENLSGSRRTEETTTVSGGFAPLAGLADIHAKAEVTIRRRVVRAKAFGASRSRPNGKTGDGAHNDTVPLSRAARNRPSWRQTALC